MRKLKCRFCGAQMEQGDVFCSACGKRIGKNIESIPQDKIRTPKYKTIMEVKKWHDDLEYETNILVPCFFYENFSVKNAFGVYKDEKEDFIVYENVNGRRICYRGKNEMMAASTLYYELKSVFENKKNVENAAQEETKDWYKCVFCGTPLAPGTKRCPECMTIVRHDSGVSENAHRGASKRTLKKRKVEHPQESLTLSKENVMKKETRVFVHEDDDLLIRDTEEDDYEIITNVKQHKEKEPKNIIAMVIGTILLGVVAVIGFAFINTEKEEIFIATYDQSEMTQNKEFDSDQVKTNRYYIANKKDIYFYDWYIDKYYWHKLENMEWVKVSESKEDDIRPNNIQVDKAYTSAKQIQEEYGIEIRIPEIYGGKDYMRIHGIKSQVQSTLDKDTEKMLQQYQSYFEQQNETQGE